MTSLDYNPKYSSDTKLTYLILDSHKIEYTIIDVVHSKTEWDKLKLKKKVFPVISIYGIPITYEDLQDLHDSETLEQVLKGGKKRTNLNLTVSRVFEKMHGMQYASRKCGEENMSLLLEKIRIFCHY